MYMLFQVIGAILGSVILWGLTSNASLVGTGANVCQEGVSIMGGLLAEVVFTFVFVLVVLGTTDAQKRCRKFCRTCHWPFFGTCSLGLYSLYRDFGQSGT